MKKDTTQKKKMIPSYAILPLLICVAVNFTVYIGTDKLMEHRNFYDLTLPIDRMVPVIPAFSVIYIGCYLFWIVNYIMITRMNRSHCYRFILADVMSRLVCGFFYIVMPTTNVRPVVNGTDIFSQMLRWVYQIDDPTRLFPSIHCLVSWFCYIRNPWTEADTEVVSEVQFCICNFSLCITGRYKAALYCGCFWRHCCGRDLLPDFR